MAKSHSMKNDKNTRKRKGSQVIDDGSAAKKQCLETIQDDKSPKGFVGGATILEKRSKLYFPEGVSDEDVRPILERGRFLELWDLVVEAQKQGKARYVGIKPAPQVFGTGTSGHTKKMKGKKDHRTDSTRKFLYQVHLDLYLDWCYILAGDGELLRSRIRQYVLEPALQQLENLQQPRSAKKQNEETMDELAEKRKEIVQDLRAALFHAISRFIVKYWIQPRLDAPRVKGTLEKTSGELVLGGALILQKTFLKLPEPSSFRRRSYSHGDAIGLGKGVLLSELMLDFKQNIESRLQCIADFLSDETFEQESERKKKKDAKAEETKRYAASNIWDKFLNYSGAEDELVTHMETQMQSLSINKPVGQLLMPSDYTLKCRKSSCAPHVGYYLGDHNQVCKWFPDVDAKWCLDARAKLPVQFVCANGKFMPGATEKIEPNGLHLIVCPLCEGQTFEQMKSKGDGGCHCTRLYNEDLEEYECRLVEAIVPAHLHNLVVGPPSCISSGHAGALNLNRFLVFAQLCEQFTCHEAIEMIDGPDPIGAAKARGKLVKTIQLVAYRPALVTSK